MENENPQGEEKDPRKSPEYFWDFRGHDFVKPPDAKIYEPMPGRPNDDRQTNSPKPISIAIKRDFFEWVMLISGWCISVLTLGIIGVYTYYAGGQWEEMRKATKASTEAANTAACALSENQRQFQKTIMEMGEQTKIQGRAATATQGAANAATSAATTAATQLESTQRPWIFFEAAINGPLQFESTGGASFKFLFSEKNMGPGIATQIVGRSEIYITKLVNGLDLSDEGKRLCEEATHAPSDKGHILFPQQSPYLEDVTGFLSGKDIKAYQDINATRLHIHESRFPAFLIGCVAYSPTFNPSKRYYTGAIYSIATVDGSIEVQKNLPPNKLRLGVVHGERTLAR